MARRVKCQDTGEYSTSDVAYRAANGKYYSSMAGYQQLEEQKVNRKKCIDALFEILGFDKDIIVPTILFKNLKSYEKMGYDVVYDTIIEETKDINWALQNVNFQNTNGMIMYVCKILEGHMVDVYQRKKFERCHAKRPDVAPIDIEIHNKKQKSKDISRFLEE